MAMLKVSPAVPLTELIVKARVASPPLAAKVTDVAFHEASTVSPEETVTVSVGVTVSSALLRFFR